MRARLPDWMRVRRPELPWRARRVLLADLVLWLVCCLPVVLGQFVPTRSAVLWWVVPLAIVAVAVLVAVARLYPLVSLAGILGTALLDPSVIYVAPVLAFLAGRRMRRPEPALAACTVVVAVGTVLTPLLGIPVNEWLVGMVVLLLAMVLPWLAGRSWRQYRELMRAGWQRAEQLEREQRIVSDQARLRERARIAQDMHDSLGHELSLLGLRAGALELAPGLDDEQRRAAGELRAGAANATDRLREIIGVLRDEPESAPIEPVHESVSALVERTAASGLDVTLDDDVDPAELDPAEQGLLLERAVYRVVQEALTNATKHSPGAAVIVEVRRSADETVVTVANGAARGGRPAARATGRRGLIGLRERVRLFGGSLSAAPTAEGGFLLTARLPHTADLTHPQRQDSAEESSESARRLVAVRRRARRSLLASLIIPGCIAALLCLVMAIQYTYNTYRSTLAPATYAKLRVGQPRTDVAGVLPQREYEERPKVVEPARPAAATCRYYRVQRSLLNLPSDVYRLCFVGGRLASKDRISDD